MSRNCYGRINHSSYLYNDLKFESTADRDAFQAEFEAYHEKHDHDGEVPTFVVVKRGDINKETYNIPLASECTIDGYQAHEIYAYHDRDDDSYVHYSPPTTCVHPVIVLKMGGDFIDSGTLERHALSALFSDMPDDDFQKLLASVEKNGFIDPIIRVHEGQILDGWHRYSAGLQLNLVRKLRFKVWKPDQDGGAYDFVMGRNLNRRHLTPSQRAQIVVDGNEWLEKGDVASQKDEGGVSRDTPKPKSRKELAAEANVGTATISRAKEVNRTGRSKEVRDGRKAASEVLKEEKEKTLAESREKAKAASTRMWQALWAIKSAVHADNFITAMCQAHPNWGVETIPVKHIIDMPEVWESRFNLVTTEISSNFPSAWVTEFLESEYSELGADRLEMPLNDEPEAEQQPEVDAYPKEADEAFWNAFDQRVPKWKAKYAESGFKEDELIQAASDEALFEAYRIYKESDAKGELTTAEITDLTELMKRASYPFARAVRDLMRAKYFVPEPEVEQPSDTDDTPDNEETQQDHVKRLEELPGEIKAYIPKWIGANPVRAKRFQGLEGKVTLKLLLNARSQIEFGRERGADPFFREEMEELLDAMQTNSAALIDKVCELLEPTESGEASDSTKTDVISEARAQVSEMLEDMNGKSEPESESSAVELTKIVVWYKGDDGADDYISFGGDHPTKPLEELPLLVRTMLQDQVK